MLGGEAAQFGVECEQLWKCCPVQHCLAQSNKGTMGTPNAIKCPLGEQLSQFWGVNVQIIIISSFQNNAFQRVWSHLD